MNGMLAKILFVLLITFFYSCKDDTTTTNPYIAYLIGGKTPYSPTIYNIEPKRGNPNFTTPPSFGFVQATFDPTIVTITGKNFIPSTTGNTVLFNDVQAQVDFATETELKVKVPQGAISGVLSVSNNGGSCNSFDKKSGVNCEGQDFFIDCYGAYKGIYGAETAVGTGTNKTITYTGIGTKAFRSDLLYTDPYTNDGALNKISVTCATLTSVLVFSSSCVPSEFSADGTTLVFNPTIPINSKFYTVQYLLTAGKGDCTITVN